MNGSNAPRHRSRISIGKMSRQWKRTCCRQSREKQSAYEEQNQLELRSQDHHMSCTTSPCCQSKSNKFSVTQRLQQQDTCVEDTLQNAMQHQKRTFHDLRALIPSNALTMQSSLSHVSSQLSQSCLQTVLRASKSFFLYYFIFSFLFQYSCAYRLQTYQSKLPFSASEMPQNDIPLERNIRSALTPPVKHDKTTPMKRQVSASNSHRDPQRLATKLGFYVEIKKNGKVKGTRKQNVYSVFELISIKPGVVALRAKKTGRFLAMDSKGRVRSLKSYTSACNFHESLVENNFFVFYRTVLDKTGRNRQIQRQMFLGFDGKGKPKKGRKVHRNDSTAHFQKLKAKYPVKKRKRVNKKGRKKSKTRTRKTKKT